MDQNASFGYLDHDTMLDQTIDRAYDEIADLRFSGSVKVDHGLGPQEKDMIDRLSKRLWAANEQRVAREAQEKMISLHCIPSDVADKIPVTIEPLGFKGNLRYILLDYEKKAKQFEDFEI